MELHELSLHGLRNAIDTGEASPLEVAKSFLERIGSKEPSVKAYLTVVPERALEDAKRLGGGKGPHTGLWGIPYALKDNICTFGVRTTCSSKILENFVPQYSAHVYERLQESGAVLLGKTDMDEFAMGSTCENSAFQSVKNPHDLSRVPGGSSGGSAAAVAAGEAAFALGTDTGGSVRCPASYCGVTGFKPTYGTVSRYGVVAYASSLDQVGAIAKSIEDCAIVMESIAGHDARDSTSLNRAALPYTSFLRAKSVKGARIGVDRENAELGLEPSVARVYEETIETFKKMGAEIVEVKFECLKYAVPAYYLIACSEASSNLARFDGVRYGVRAEGDSLEDSVLASRSQGFGDEVKNRIMLGTYALSAGYYDMFYSKALKARRLIKDDFYRLLGECDAFLCPTMPTAAKRIGETSEDALAMYLADVYTVIANLVGVPACSFPAGASDDGLPIGMQMYAPALGEKEIFSLIHAFQSETDWHKAKPGFKESGAFK
ncbi:MAG: Asp-tRNA(Asn)/Glu-tRNA(Gln) amidotransferase subunit GatA [Eubacteriaceae bacterium]|jgi:aspartyl-tRNA(Asn)/glutamyl-tRNA(Gln) amidotransferase subunit A|nr:Asp-tRNA(Asn)/Glu-tRNA(Gln) amidotransferase subunit GatA [Eubacteriaceae bacterium]